MNYEYAGGGYYREKGIEKGKSANLLHGSEILNHVNNLENKVKEFLTLIEDSNYDVPLRQVIENKIQKRKELKALLS